jgi:dihydrofolate reductase
MIRIRQSRRRWRFSSHAINKLDSQLPGYFSSHGGVKAESFGYRSAIFLGYRFSMRRLTSIVAVNPQGVIGLGNALPWRVRSDLQFFKAQTSGNVVIMGRKTHDSLGQCLPNRHNVVVSHQFSLFDTTSNCVLQHSIPEALATAESAAASYKEIFVIGGASMYQQFSGLVDRYLVTMVDKAVPDGDAYFDPGIFGDSDNWETRIVVNGVANTTGDEADFTIFEMNARDLEQRRQARQQTLASVLERARNGPRRSRQGRSPVIVSPQDSHTYLI